MEVWKNIRGFERYYQVSNLGNVKSLDRDVVVNGGIRKYDSKPIILSEEKDGYLTVTLWRDSRSKSFRVHRLVADAFIDNSNKFEIVNHIDGNKKNNNAINLEWCNVKHNTNHAFSTGLRKSGENHRWAKLTESQVLQIPNLLADGMSQKGISKLYEVSYSCIKNICQGRKWRFLVSNNL